MRESQQSPRYRLDVCLQVEAEVQLGPQTELRVRVEASKPGLLWLEAHRGALLSTARPVIMLPAGHVNLAAEVARLVSQPAELARHASHSPPSESDSRRHCGEGSWGEMGCDDFLADLGLVLSQGTHSSSASADLAHAWQCCVAGRQQSASGCSCCAATAVRLLPSCKCQRKIYKRTPRGKYLKRITLQQQQCCWFVQPFSMPTQS